MPANRVEISNHPDRQRPYAPEANTPAEVPLHGRWRTPRSGWLLWPLIITAFCLDMALHIGFGVLVVWATRNSVGIGAALALGVLTALAISFVHRTFIQRLARTTLGKAPFGLLIRHPDGRLPTLRELVKQWFVGAGEIFSLTLS